MTQLNNNSSSGSKPARPKKKKPVPVSKEQLTTSIVENIPKLYGVNQHLVSLIDLLKNTRNGDVTFSIIESIDKCLKDFESQDPKQVLKQLRSIMRARLKTKTAEIISER